MTEHLGSLSLQSISKTFAGHLSLWRRTVVSDLSLEVMPGEIFGFLGQNGAGKTTTIKMIVGLIFPTRGRITIAGRPHTDPSSRERLGYLPENPHFYDYLTAEEFLRYYGRLYGMGAEALRRAVPKVLARVGLCGQEHLHLRKYSKGMLQRVGIAQAILHDPAIVVLDEPMSGLDPIGRRDVRDLMLELRERGTTVFFSSHILQDAEMVCDRVAIIASGRLITVGTLSELLRVEEEAYEVLLRRLPAEAVASLGEVAAVRSEKAGGHLFRAPSTAACEELLRRAIAAGARVEQVTPQRQSLEDLFLRASGASP